MLSLVIMRVLRDNKFWSEARKGSSGCKFSQLNRKFIDKSGVDEENLF